MPTLASVFLPVAGPASPRNSTIPTGKLIKSALVNTASAAPARPGSVNAGLFIAPGLYSPLLIQIFMAAAAVVAAKILKLAR